MKDYLHQQNDEKSYSCRTNPSKTGNRRLPVTPKIYEKKIQSTPVDSTPSCHKSLDKTGICYTTIDSFIKLRASKCRFPPSS